MGICHGRGKITITHLDEGIIAEYDVEVPLTDGGRMLANVFRPRSSDKVPVLMHYVPYGKDDVFSSWSSLGLLPVPLKGPIQYGLMRYVFGGDIGELSFSDATPWEAADPAVWTRLGYGVVSVDSRGFCKAGGANVKGGIVTQQEAEDFRDAIEWAARLPWSSGNVGTLGVSYLAISQWNVAARAPPPSLKAMCPWEGLHDLYEICFPGCGVSNFGERWLTLTPKLAPGGLVEDIVGELKKTKENNSLRNDFWKSKRIPCEQIRQPAVLACASWSDQGVHNQLRGGTFDAWELCAAQHKFLYNHGGKKWDEFYHATQVQKQFFDHFLKGIDNGFERAGGRVRLEVRETKELRHQRWEHDWPLGRAVMTKMFLAVEGRLELQPSACSELELKAGTDTAVFSHTFQEDTEVTGFGECMISLKVLDATDADVDVQLHKLDAEGQQVFFDGVMGDQYEGVTKGMLRVSHRASLDESRSRPGHPFYTKECAVAAPPFEAVVLRVPLMPHATLFRRGEALQLTVAAGRNLHHTGFLPVCQSGKLTSGAVALQLGESHLLLPVIPDGPSLLARSSVTDRHSWIQ